MRLSSNVVSAQLSFSAGSPVRFGVMRPSEENKVFKLLPPEARVMELINRYEQLSRVPLGFETPERREARADQRKNVEKQLLGEIQNPKYTQKHASALLLELYQSREGLQQQLPEAIFDAIYRKATLPPKASKAEPDKVPENVRNRMNNDGTPLVVSRQDLAALLGEAAKRGYGQN